jgi:hypothetical protein
MRAQGSRWRVPHAVARNRSVRVIEVIVDDDVTAEINARHRAALADGRVLFEHARRCGELLAEARQAVGAENWPAWLREYFDGDEASAQRYMELANGGGPLGPGSRFVGSARPAALDGSRPQPRLTAPPEPEPVRRPPARHDDVVDPPATVVDAPAVNGKVRPMPVRPASPAVVEPPTSTPLPTSARTARAADALAEIKAACMYLTEAATANGQPSRAAEACMDAAQRARKAARVFVELGLEQLHHDGP